MNRIVFLSLIGLLISSCSKDRNDGRVEGFSALSLNAFLLDTPDITTGPSCESDCVARAQSICQVLSDRFESTPDILMFQEVFEEDACNSLEGCLDDLNYRHHSPCLENDPSWENSCLVRLSKTSGLFLASKVPLNDYTFQSFEACNGCVLRGADCQANKGFQYANISLSDNCKLHMVNTHLDAGTQSADQEARRAQVIQISNFISNLNFTQNDKIIYGGDLNTTTLAELLEIELRLSAKSLNQNIATSASGFVLDHILVPTSPSFSDKSVMLAQTCDQECIGWFDSDHIGVLSNFSFSCD